MSYRLQGSTQVQALMVDGRFVYAKGRKSIPKAAVCRSLGRV